MEEYRNNFIVKSIDGRDDSIEFVNGIKIYAGDVIGKVSEEQLRRIQIRETILSHIERERQLFYKGIKVLSLFFIDKVEHYRKYEMCIRDRKHLIQGNHDSFLLKDESLLKEFESIDKMTYTKDGTYTIVLCHFPIAEWNQYWRGSWHIYGHIHNQKKGCFDFMTEKDRALNAGCMINHYAPVTIEQLIENNRTYKKNCWYELCLSLIHI